MRREDWLWLSVKLAGVWLIVIAVGVMADPGWSWFDYGRYDTSGRDQLLRVLVPLAAGLCLLLIDFSAWLPVTPPRREPEHVGEPETGQQEVATQEVGAQQPDEQQDAPSAPPRAPLDRADWLWLGLKLIGAFWAVQMVIVASQMVMFQLDRVPWYGFLMLATGLAVPLWLLFGDTVWRLALGSLERSDARQPSRRRRPIGIWSYIGVVLLFLALLGLPILLLWWSSQSGAGTLVA